MSLLKVSASIPVKGAIYTLEQILLDLNLNDSPFLRIKLKDGSMVTIQDSHVTVDELLSVPGFAETTWRYVRETNEWIPLFDAVDVMKAMACVDDTLIIKGDDIERWVTPKGFPRNMS